MTNHFELNIDGLVGPTHHYAGLSTGNIASENNARSEANPKAAALQGIEKMKILHEMGIKQAVMPPHARPNLQLLNKLGFSGALSDQLHQAYKESSHLLSAIFSASSMWTANAATVSASPDTKDGRVHFTAANLASNIHRSQESDFSSFLLKIIFSNEQYFNHHNPLPCSDTLGDEGAANHNRLCETYEKPGINLFVYGKKALPANNNMPRPYRYPARQTLEASQAIARTHQLNTDQVIFACQNPEVIEAGVFHNDVISVANESMYLIHEKSFIDQQQILTLLRQKCNFEPTIVEVLEGDVSVKEAVQSYLFNSQLISIPSDGDTKKMILIAPYECQENTNIATYIKHMIDDKENPLNQVKYMDLKQSMKNGGGPACLRLRVPLSDDAFYHMNQGVVINDGLLDQLKNWVHNHYRDTLNIKDLVDHHFVDETYTALDELTQILNLGSIYPFQQTS